jgi:transglutaminase-like putative cysteine protease
MIKNQNNKSSSRIIFLTVISLINSALLSAQVNFRVMPAVSVPIGSEYFTSGFGATASLDRSFSLDNRWSLGASIAGGLASLPVNIADSSPFSMFQAGAGPALSFRISDRFSARADYTAGIYYYSQEDLGNVKFFTGGSLSGIYHLTPAVSFYADAGFYWHDFSASQSINSVKAGVGVQLNLADLLRPSSRLEGERIRQLNVFPVNFAWYEKNPVAVIRVTNNETHTIYNIRLSFLLERYMNHSSHFKTIDRLAPGESVEAPVTALFNESMLTLTETIHAPASVIAEYRSLGVTQKGVFRMEMPIYSRNSMIWDDDRRAASFVSSRDPAAVYFARYVESAIADSSSAVPRNVRIAAALFEALRLYGISYIIDPSSSYVALSMDGEEPDTLNYPYETLLYRGGDCDDLSILFTSLLETLGVESAFITVPGHIFAAFSTGDSGWQTGNRDVIELDGKRWAPLELTIPDRGFAEALRVGGRQYRSAGGEAKLFPMKENWLFYPGVSVNAAGDNMPSMPEKGAVSRALESELRKLK